MMAARSLLQVLWLLGPLFTMEQFSSGSLLTAMDSKYPLPVDDNESPLSSSLPKKAMLVPNNEPQELPSLPEKSLQDNEVIELVNEKITTELPKTTVSPTTTIETTTSDSTTESESTSSVKDRETTPAPSDDKMKEESSPANNSMSESKSHSDGNGGIISTISNGLKKLFGSTSDREGKSLKFNKASSALSGNEPSSGPSPDGFGPVDDLPPLVFPHPAVQGREDFIPLQTLDRERVSQHFQDRDDAAHEESNFIDTISSSADGNTFFTVRERTPKPGRKPMLMTLTPKPLGRDGKKLDVGAFHRGPILRPSISIEAKGDNGQIKRIIPTSEEHHHFQEVNPHFFEEELHSLDVGDLLTRGIDPLLFNANSLLDLQNSHLHRRFSQFGPTVPPPYGFPVTLTSGHLGSLGHDPSTIFHGPPFAHGGRVNGFHDPIIDEKRRPLTRDHFLVHETSNNELPLLRPREPNHKIPFGLNYNDDYDRNILAPGSNFIKEVEGIRFETNGHGHPLPYSGNYGPSFLVPNTPRPFLTSTPFFHGSPSTPQSFHRVSVTPVPGHASFNTISPHLIHKTTPRPHFEILSVTPTPKPSYFSDVDHHNSNRPSYLPRPKPPASHAVSVTTFNPIGRPPIIINTTPAPPPQSIIVTSSRPALRPHPNRGAHKYRPPGFVGFPGESLASLAGTDFSTQYQSGEHLSHQQSRPFLPFNSLSSEENSKEYTYHYAVHSPSTGDIKSAHESKLPHGGVVGGYSLLQPDGVTRQVSYTADEYNGFQANVEYITPDGRKVVPGKK